MHETMERLYRAAKDLCGVTGQSAVAQLLGESPQTLNNWEDRGISKRGAVIAQERIGCSSVWVAEGKGQMSAADQLIRYPVYPASSKKVWVVGKSQGGFPERIWTDGDYPVGATDEFAEVATGDPHAFLVPVVGDSMAPRYQPGEYALVEPGTEPDIEDDVLVRLTSGETILKRLLSRRDGYRLGSWNGPTVLTLRPEEVVWMYYVAHPVPSRKIKNRM